MTKRELIEEVATRWQGARSEGALERERKRHKAKVEALVNAVFATLGEALARGERIEIRGFGSFVVKRRRAREGLNPKTGAPVAVAAKRVPFFKAGKELRLRVDGKGSADAPAPASSARLPAALSAEK